MRRSYLVGVLALLFTSGPLLAQGGGTISGRVISTGDGQPVPGVTTVSYTHLTLPTNREV